MVQKILDKQNFLGKKFVEKSGFKVDFWVKKHILGQKNVGPKTLGQNCWIQKIVGLYKFWVQNFFGSLSP